MFGLHAHLLIFNRLKALLSKVFVENYGPTGYLNNIDGTVTTASNINFVENTKTFSISSVSGKFYYYILGYKYVQIGNKSKVISDTYGEHFLYFDRQGVLIDDTDPPEGKVFFEVAYTANVFWNPTQQRAIIISDERHSSSRNNSTHYWSHAVELANYVSGLTLTNFVIGDGSLDSHVQFACTDGETRDEDLSKKIVNNAPQQLSPLLDAPVLFFDGVEWCIDLPTVLPIKSFVGGSGLAAYNQITGGIGAQIELTSGRYMVNHVLKTGDTRWPIAIVQGRFEYLNAPAARTGVTKEITGIEGLPGPEITYIGSYILQSSTTYTNTKKARIVYADGATLEYIDFRQFSGSRMNMLKELITNYLP